MSPGECREEPLTRRTFLTGAAAAGGTLLLTGETIAAEAKKTFTILHTNDIHSNLLGVGPVSEYTPATLKDDRTIGGMERIATLIAERRKAREAEGPVLVLDIGDFSIGTPFGGAFVETGAELQCLALAGYDATTFGNHEFDSGPAALAKGIKVAWMAGRMPAILAANTNFTAADPGLEGLRDLARVGVLRSHMVIERGGIKFGLFGMMGPDSIQFTINPGALTFPDPIETARKMVKQLREEGADVIICMSHGGVMEPKKGPITEGDDINLARAVPGIDVIVGGHTHTFVREPILVNGTPVLQAGCYGKALGELVMQVDGRDRKVASYKLHSIDDTIPGDPRLARAMDGFKAETSRIVFKPRGFKIDEPLAVIDRDWPNTFFDLAASLPIGNLMADSIRHATKADVALSTAGMVRAGMTKGTHGVQTAYDLYLLAPLGIGVADQSGGGSLVVAYFTGSEIKNLLEFFLAGNPNLPGQYFPRVSGMRFRYDPSRPEYDVVTQIELGDLDRGYRVIDVTEKSKDLHSVTCNLYVGIVSASIPAKTKGKLPLTPKKKDGTPLKSRTEALPDRPQAGPYLLPPKGTIDKDEVVKGAGAGSTQEIKEWQAVMDYLKSLPKKNARGVTVLEMDERSKEVRAIRAS